MTGAIGGPRLRTPAARPQPRAAGSRHLQRASPDFTGAWARAAVGALLALACASASANGDGAPPGLAFGVQLSGERFTYEVRPGDSLGSIGARHGQSASLIARDNAIGPREVLRPGRRLLIDNRHVVPEQSDDGILINVPQRMLFHYEAGSLRAAYPVTVGRPDWRTPLGPFRVINRQQDKPWFVPKSIQAEMAREGKPVLTRVEPGPDNPLGRHWIGLSMPAIGIHGTNAPSSIYALRSHGCIRMHPDDVAELFDRVSVGTPGRIVYHPALLAAVPDGRVFLEANRDAYRLAGASMASLLALAEARGIADRIDWQRAEAVLAAREGIAREVTRSVTPASPSGAGVDAGRANSSAGAATSPVVPSTDQGAQAR